MLQTSAIVAMSRRSSRGCPTGSGRQDDARTAPHPDGAAARRPRPRRARFERSGAIVERHPAGISSPMRLQGVGEEQFRLLVESVKDYAIFLLDIGGHIVSWN